MIIFSNKSADSILKVERNNSRYSIEKVKVSFDFGSYIGYDTMGIALKDMVLSAIVPDLNDDAIFEKLDTVSQEEVYCYSLDEETAELKHLSISELLSSDNQDEFAIGVLMASRERFNELDTTLDEEIDFGGKTIFNLTAPILKEMVLSQDKEGIASFILDLTSDNDELYNNVLKLDKTGEISILYLTLLERYDEKVANKILEVDKSGDLIIEVLNWLNDSPIEFARRIVELGNPFKVIDFKKRYEYYLDCVRDSKADTLFVKEESSIISYLNHYLIECKYSELDQDLLSEEVFYENPQEEMLAEIFNLAKEADRLDTVENLLKYLNHDTIRIIENSEPVQKSEIELVDSYTCGEIVIFVISVKGKSLYFTNTKERYQEVLELLLKDRESYISLSELL